MTYVSAFIVGGIICAIGQILIDKTKLTSARFLVVYVDAAVELASLGIYQKIVDIGVAGATIPLTGFGYNLAKGVFREVDEKGLLGIFTGGFTAGAAGLAAAVFFGFMMAAIFKPKAKK